MKLFEKDTEAMRAAIALGAEVGAVVGSRVYELEEYGGQYEDYSEYPIGFFSDEESARAQMIICIFHQSEWLDETPWGPRPRDEENQTSPLDPWHEARRDWFEAHSFEEIFEWYEREGSNGYDSRDYRINVHVVLGAPALKYELPRAED